MTPRECEPHSPKASCPTEPFSPFRAARQMNVLSPSRLHLQTKAASKARPESHEELQSDIPAEDSCFGDYFEGYEEEEEEEQMEHDAEFF